MFWPRVKIFSQLFFDRRGNILLFAMVFGFISFTVIFGGVSSYALFENRASAHKSNRELAFQMADAGINYYRWHLAHDQNDFQDGTATSGPYIHDYRDKDGNVIGHFSLDITPPLLGSTVVTIESTGWTDAFPDTRRTVRARVGFPALTDYAFLSQVDVWIGNTEVVHGKFHSNGGIRFDGVGDAPITSATPTYICKAHHGCGNQQKPGIWGAGGPTQYWDFPVSAKDFDAVTAKLSEIERKATYEGGVLLESSGVEGWRLEFLGNGTMRVYPVNTTDCYKGKDVGSNQYVWYCIDIASTGTSFVTSTGNGYIFAQDTVWVDGVVAGRVVVGTDDGESIIINGNITYIAKDGNHVLGLIGQQNVLIPHNSLNDLEVDAAILAQRGGAKRYYYSGDVKNSLVIYGSVISNGTWTWSWTSGGSVVVSGYRYTNAIYDANLTYGPPPGFPVGSEYNLISWEIVR